MILWINGAFGSGKTTTAFELSRRIPGSFVFDPENAGYFIRKNAPEAFSGGDFQDIPLWREINREMLRMVCGGFDGVVICPMTLVNPVYFDEIIGELTRSGVDVRHFILYANRETILKRLRLRSIRLLGKESFAVNSIDRCIRSFDSLITETKIATDAMTVDEVVSEIARLSGIPLAPEKRPRIKRFADRCVTLIRHIRH